VSPSSRATSSIGFDAWLEKIIGTHSPRAARATARSASRSTISRTPTGASMNGLFSRWPNSSTLVSRCDTSRSIRGTIFQRSNAARFARTVCSVPAPAAM